MIHLSRCSWITKDKADASCVEDQVIIAQSAFIVPQRVQCVIAGREYTVEPYYN